MDNENKWEYDYSSQDKNESGDTGYPNVGSSGMNTANQYNDPQPEPETAYTAPQTDNGAGGATPPVHPVQPQDAQPPKKKKKFNGKRVARSAVALVLAAAMGFAGGFVGAKFGGSGKVVIQQVAPSSTADSASGSDNSITAASSSGSSLTTEQVADLVSPSVVVITTEQVVYSQWSWYGQNQVESGAGSGVIISSDGYILTCAHVVDGASTITVTIGDKDYTATLVGEDTTYHYCCHYIIITCCNGSSSKNICCFIERTTHINCHHGCKYESKKNPACTSHSCKEAVKSCVNPTHYRLYNKCHSKSYYQNTHYRIYKYRCYLFQCLW